MRDKMKIIGTKTEVKRGKALIQNSIEKEDVWKIREQQRKEAERKILKAKRELINSCIDYQTAYGIMSVEYEVKVSIPFLY